MPDQNKNYPQSSAPEKGDRETATKKKKLYDVCFFYAWCKACGLCEEFCPKKIIETDKTGMPSIADPDSCSGCRFCEKHCPDFAIRVEVRMPRRRRTDE